MGGGRVEVVYVWVLHEIFAGECRGSKIDFPWAEHPAACLLHVGVARCRDIFQQSEGRFA